MRFLMFEHASSRRLGALRDGRPDQVVDLRELARATGAPSPPDDLLALIDSGERGLEQAGELLARLGPDVSVAPPVVRSLGELSLLPPLDPPRGNVLAIGRNYARHAEEGARARAGTVLPPTIFTKAITSVTAPHADLPVDPAVSTEMDWEAELGVVVGRRGVNVRRRDAPGHVFGYTVLNDVTARDVQHNWGGQFFKGKSLDGTCPVGPWVVTRDELPDPQALGIRLRVNGETKQDASTGDMIYPVDAIIEWLSVGMTLLPGALIATGTPEGVGFARNPPQFLQPGDVMETEIDGIGTLRNRIVTARSLAGGSPSPPG